MLKVLDLFSGVGGMSLGAAQAGFSITGAVEWDAIAIKTHAINFPNTKHIESDISKLHLKDIKSTLNLKVGELSGIIGGPPCQGFSVMGRQDIDDPRSSLFVHYFRLVNQLKPEFFVAENVPGILDSKFDFIRKEAFSLVSKDYDFLEPLLIKANEVGAATIRKRVFFIGFRKKSFLSRKIIDFSKSNDVRNNVCKALEGLPIDVEVKEDAWTTLLKTASDSYSNYISRYNFPEKIGSEVALERYFVKNEVSGMIGTSHQAKVIERFREVEPGKIDRISKAPKLDLEGYCPTLRAGTSKEKGSYQAVRPIHPLAPRVITPREAARFQGFPDWFQFDKTKWHSFRQIGNSVSPIVSKFIMEKIIEHYR